MGDHDIAITVIARGVALGLGSLLTVIAFQAYRRTHPAFTRWAASGFGVVTVGVVVEGLLYHVGGLALVSVHPAGSLTVGSGFAWRLDSLHRE